MYTTVLFKAMHTCISNNAHLFSLTHSFIHFFKLQNYIIITPWRSTLNYCLSICYQLKFLNRWKNDTHSLQINTFYGSFVWIYNNLNQKKFSQLLDRVTSSSKPQYMQWPSLSFVHMVRKPIWWHEKMSLRHLIVYIKYISHSLNSFFLLV